MVLLRLLDDAVLLERLSQPRLAHLEVGGGLVHLLRLHSVHEHRRRVLQEDLKRKVQLVFS